MNNVLSTSGIAVIKNTSVENTIVEISIMQDCEDVFQDVSRLPSKRKIDICIELVPGMLSISRTPYWMERTEMLEPKNQV